MSQGPQVIQTRQLVRFQLRILQQAIAYLETNARHAAAAKALHDHFIRPVPAGDEACCNWAEVCGPCPSWKPDSSGGYCRECGHHKSCHAGFRPHSDKTPATPTPAEGQA